MKEWFLWQTWGQNLQRIAIEMAARDPGSLGLDLPKFSFVGRWGVCVMLAIGHLGPSSEALNTRGIHVALECHEHAVKHICSICGRRECQCWASAG